MDLTLLTTLAETPAIFRRDRKVLDLCAARLQQLPDVALLADTTGNLFAFKGRAEKFPCLVAHLDTVQSWTEAKARIDDDGVLRNYDANNRQIGVGGDCKSGVFAAMEAFMAAKTPVMLALFDGEECGGVGSSSANIHVLQLASCFIGLDCPSTGLCSYSTAGCVLAEDTGELFARATPVLARHGYVHWQHHPFTDTAILRRRLDVACLNLSSGYYHWHSDRDCIKLSDVATCIDMLAELVPALGTRRYSMLNENGWNPPGIPVTPLRVPAL